jgi:hypothetical protein
MNPDISEETHTSASDTLVGATSAHLHQGYGHPGSGQTSTELRDKKERSGFEGRGGDPSQPPVPRDAQKDHRSGVRSDRENLKDAEDREPAGPDEVASEMP